MNMHVQRLGGIKLRCCSLGVEIWLCLFFVASHIGSSSHSSWVDLIFFPRFLEDF